MANLEKAIKEFNEAPTMHEAICNSVDVDNYASISTWPVFVHQVRDKTSHKYNFIVFY